jgi:hypothetical protein
MGSDSGPWRNLFYCAMEASLRAPFIIRWPGKVPAGRVSNEIVHIVDTYPTLARVGRAEVPKDRLTTASTSWIFFLASRRTPIAKGSPPMWPTGYLPSSGATGGCTSFGK